MKNDVVSSCFACGGVEQADASEHSIAINTNQQSCQKKNYGMVVVLVAAEISWS